jgi:3-hexulose-6-phosphate synthase
MQLLMALDFITMEGAKKILKEVADVIDLVEIGTPFIVQDGVRAVREVRAAYPQLKIMADLKIMDAGEHETRTALEAGANIVSVLGVADDATILSAVTAAKQAGQEILVDMIGVADLERRAEQVDKLGVNYICVHTAFDLQGTGKSPLDELLRVKKVVKSSKIAVAGGIKLTTIGALVEARPDIVIVGGAISGAFDHRKAAQDLKAVLVNAGGRK